MKFVDDQPVGTDLLGQNDGLRLSAPEHSSQPSHGVGIRRSLNSQPCGAFDVLDPRLAATALDDFPSNVGRDDDLPEQVMQEVEAADTRQVDQRAGVRYRRHQRRRPNSRLSSSASYWKMLTPWSERYWMKSA